MGQLMLTVSKSIWNETTLEIVIQLLIDDKMIHIDFTKNSFQINSRDVTFPMPVEDMELLLGIADEVFKGKGDMAYLWSNLGLRAFSNDGKLLYGIELTYRVNQCKHSPKKTFAGKIHMEGQDLKEYYKHHQNELVKQFKDDEDGKFIFHNHSIWINMFDGEWECVMIQAYEKPTNLAVEKVASDKEFQHLVPLWENWIKAIKMYVDEDNAYYNLTHGITAKQQDELQAQFDKPLPAVLTNFYKIHNVTWDAVASAFHFTVNGWSYDLLPFEKIYNEWDAIRGLIEEDEELEETLKEGFSDKTKSQAYANPMWIPFAEGRNGNYLLIDTDPSEKGQYGQIIELINEFWQRQVISSSLEELLQLETEKTKKEGKEKFSFVNEKKPIITPLRTIRHLIPSDCHYFAVDSDYENVIYYETDLELRQSLDLDDAYKHFFGESDEYRSIFFILINGNCTAQSIYNRETDGATGLIVLGSLYADNIAVGGQEIYVRGDMECRELYWGDYNHGLLQVTGKISAKVFLCTDYGVAYDRFTEQENIAIDYLLWDEITDNDDFEDNSLIKKLFLPEFVARETELIDDLYSWSDWLQEDLLFNALETGKPILRPDIAVSDTEESTVLFLFADNSISAENLQEFGSGQLWINQTSLAGQELVAEYWDKRIFYRILEMSGQPLHTIVYIQVKEECAYMIGFSEQSKNLLHRLSGKKEYSLFITYRLLPSGKWIPVNDKLDRFHIDFLQGHWQKLQADYSEMVWTQQQFREQITKEKIESILNLPLIRDRHSDYYSDDEESSIYHRSYEWQFRQASDNECPRISIIWYVNEEDTLFYHFDLEKAEDGELAPLLRTQDDENLYDADVTERYCYQNAIRCFGILEQVIFKKNLDYEEGGLS